MKDWADCGGTADALGDLISYVSGVEIRENKHIGVSGNVYHSMGYNGSGVARASHAGHQVALQMLGLSKELTAWNALAFERLPFRAFSRLGVAIAINWKRWQDRRS